MKILPLKCEVVILNGAKRNEESLDAVLSHAKDSSPIAQNDERRGR